MFPDCCWQKRQFAESPRYNVRCTRLPPQPDLPRPTAARTSLGNYYPYSLFLDDDMTTNAGAQDLASGSRDLLQPWQRIAQRLCPLIGESGFCALFGRAVHMVGPDHAWLAPQQPCRSTEQLFASLAERLAPVEPGQAAAANDTMLQTFTKLLATLIGEALTQRLLASATASADQPANAQEQK